MLLVTVALLVVYVISIGGATATAIRIGEAWRRRQAASGGLGPRSEGEVMLPAKALPAVVRRIRLAGWVVFPVALVLAVFANRTVVELSWLGVVVVFIGIAIAFADLRGRF